MLRFKADKFYRATRILSTLAAKLDEGSIKDEPSEATRKKFREMFDELSGLLTDLGLPMSKKSAARAKDCFKEDAKFSHKLCGERIEELLGRVQDELEQSFLLCLPTAALEQFEPKDPLFGKEVDAAFPSAAYDIAECGKCFALGRSTASVMHAMRALEPALVAMAQDLGITLSRDNWGEALLAIEKTLPAASREQREFFSGAAAQFRYFKDAWRNQAMHARLKYTPEEADIVLRASRAFMRHLATQLKEVTA